MNIYVHLESSVTSEPWLNTGSAPEHDVSRALMRCMTDAEKKEKSFIITLSRFGETSTPAFCQVALGESGELLDLASFYLAMACKVSFSFAQSLMRSPL